MKNVLVKGIYWLVEKTPLYPGSPPLRPTGRLVGTGQIKQGRPVRVLALWKNAMCNVIN